MSRSSTGVQRTETFKTLDDEGGTFLRDVKNPPTQHYKLEDRNPRFTTVETA